MLVPSVFSNTEFVAAENTRITIARFICAVVLHMELQDEGYQGLSMMKYALNHSWRFDHPGTAFMAGFLQVSVVFLVEFVNILAILSSQSEPDIVMNFLALTIIANFDDLFFRALRGNEFKS